MRFKDALLARLDTEIDTEARGRDKAALSAEVLQTTRMMSVHNRRLAAPRKLLRARQPRCRRIT
jgi:hypothetical protein